MERLSTAFPAELGDVQPVVWLVLVAVLYPPTLTDAVVEKSMRRYVRQRIRGGGAQRAPAARGAAPANRLRTKPASAAAVRSARASACTGGHH